MNPRRSPAVVLTILVLVPSVVGQTPSGSDVQTADRFVVSTVDGPPADGRWTHMHDGGRTLVLDVDGASQTFAVSEIVSVRSVSQQTASRRAPAGRSVVLLAGGDRLYADVVAASEEALTLRSAQVGRVNVPWEAVQAVVLHPPDDEAAKHQLIRRLLDHAQPHDLVVIQNGDTLHATLLEIDQSEVRVESDGRPAAVPRASIAGIAMNPDLIERRQLDGLHAMVLTTDGSRLTVRPLTLEDGLLQLESSYGATFQLALRHLRSLRFLGGNVVYLSDLEPESYRHVPYLGLNWPWVGDASVGRRPMRLRGELVTKGLGMHSRAELTYNLAARYRRFDATVGIDDETRGQGSAVFRVLVDGRERFASPVVRGHDPALPLDSIDVTGAARLTLIVEFADRGDVRDHADWAYARLVK